MIVSGWQKSCRCSTSFVRFCENVSSILLFAFENDDVTFPASWILIQPMVRRDSTKFCRYGCFRKLWYPQIIHFDRVFHYKPSILGYPYFWKHPYPQNRWIVIFGSQQVPRSCYGLELDGNSIPWSNVLQLSEPFLFCICVDRISRWWFLFFKPLLGERIQSDSYLSNGLKPASMYNYIYIYIFFWPKYVAGYANTQIK